MIENLCPCMCVFQNKYRKDKKIQKKAFLYSFIFSLSSFLSFSLSYFEIIILRQKFVLWRIIKSNKRKHTVIKQNTTGQKKNYKKTKDKKFVSE
tara:strand:+ start:578 stop:859 length:282 start_codon:yes stop_codon:yes gene_type:complete